MMKFINFNLLLSQCHCRLSFVEFRVFGIDGRQKGWYDLYRDMEITLAMIDRVEKLLRKPIPGNIRKRF